MADNSLVNVDQLRIAAEYLRDAIAAAIDDIEITVNLDTGNLEYKSGTLMFDINEKTGNLEYSIKKGSV